jgi:hypothetical protein
MTNFKSLRAFTSLVLGAALLGPTFSALAEESNASGDIVVIARKLDNWTGKFSIKGDKVKCATKNSTGDKEIDAIGCAAMVQCLPAFQPRITASDNAALDKSVRLAMKAEIKSELTTCVKATRADLVSALAQRRAGSK